jgi:hypothetical protein
MLRLGNAHGFSALEYLKDALEHSELLKFHVSSSGAVPLPAGTQPLDRPGVADALLAS